MTLDTNAEIIAKKAKRRIRIEQQSFEARINNWGMLSPIDSYKDFRSMTGDYKEKDKQIIVHSEGEISNRLFGILNDTRTEFIKNKHHRTIEALKRNLSESDKTTIGIATAALTSGTTAAIATAITSSMTGTLFGSTFLGSLFGAALFSKIQIALIATGIGIPAAALVFFGALEWIKGKVNNSLDVFADECVKNIDEMKFEAEKAILERENKIKNAFTSGQAKTADWGSFFD